MKNILAVIFAFAAVVAAYAGVPDYQYVNTGTGPNGFPQGGFKFGSD